MKEEMQYFERIESYFDNEMSEQERKSFEQELQTNDKLKYEYQVYSVIVDSVKQGKRAELKLKLERADKEMSDIRSIKLFSGGGYFKYAIAATILLLIGISGYYFYQANQNTDSKLVATYWQKDAGLPVLMSVNGNADFDNAMTAFKSGDYAGSYTKFQTLPQSDTVSFYEGLCAFELHTNAENYIKPVAENGNSGYRSKAKYYLLLLYIKNGKKAEAIRLLNELKQDTANPYNEQIQRLSGESYFVSTN